MKSCIETLFKLTLADICVRFYVSI